MELESKHHDISLFPLIIFFGIRTRRKKLQSDSFIFSLPLPFLSDSLHCSQLCQDCDKLNYQQTAGIPDDISMIFSFFCLHESSLVFHVESIRTGSRWCWCPISAASEPLSPGDLQCQDKITKPPRAVRLGDGDSEMGLCMGRHRAAIWGAGICQPVLANLH